MINNKFQDDYSKLGFRAQREYPNTDLISFIKSINARKFLNKKKIKVLEVGSGSGSNLWMLSKEKFDVYGIDNSYSGLKLSKMMLKKWNVKAKLFYGSMTELPFKSEFFDLIVDVVSMQNISFSDHLLAWRSISRCLKKDGLFFSVHLGTKSSSFKKLSKNKKFLFDRYTLNKVTNKFPLNHNGLVCFLNGKIVKKELDILGFKEIRIEQNIRSYKDQKQHVEYLIISARKSKS